MSRGWKYVILAVVAYLVMFAVAIVSHHQGPISPVVYVLGIVVAIGFWVGLFFAIRAIRRGPENPTIK